VTVRRYFVLRHALRWRTHALVVADLMRLDERFRHSIISGGPPPVPRSLPPASRCRRPCARSTRIATPSICRCSANASMRRRFPQQVNQLSIGTVEDEPKGPKTDFHPAINPSAKLLPSLDHADESARPARYRNRVMPDWPSDGCRLRLRVPPDPRPQEQTADPQSKAAVGIGDHRTTCRRARRLQRGNASYAKWRDDGARPTLEPIPGAKADEQKQHVYEYHYPPTPARRYRGKAPDSFRGLRRHAILNPAGKKEDHKDDQHQPDTA
jgi:hypothetical protein